MKDPLKKRWIRELAGEKGKYLALFIFLAATIAFVSGFLVADNSMRDAYDGSFEKYDIENGHFSLAQKMPKALKEDVEDEGVRTVSQFYKDEGFKGNKTVRVYKIRKKANRACVMEGRLPENRTEIVIDRLFAENNGIKIGDSMTLAKKKYRIVGTIALSDYSALFENNTDMMFSATDFSVALTTKGGFERLPENDTVYQYAWLDREGKDPDDDEILDILSESMLLTDFLRRENNQAITFTGDDLGRDRSMMMTLLYVVIIILAFVFGVTTKSKIEQEATAIGTLRASGYTRGELVRHYLKPPLIIVIAAAVIGNILGYTCLKETMAGLYYHSYSLPVYKTLWNGDAFIMTTLIPAALILVIVSLMLIGMLSLPPLQFLRRELSRKKKKGAAKLPGLSFQNRFRIRVIFQNRGAYAILIVGILLANLMMVFGLVMSPILERYADEVKTSQIAKYQYVLKAPVETETKGAEKYAVTQLRLNGRENAMVYGIVNDSEYLSDMKLPSGENEVLISIGYAEKYDVEKGDTVTLKKAYGKKKYKFKVKGTYDYPAAISVLMKKDNFRKVFDEDKGYFNGYFSDRKIKDIDEDFIATRITLKDLTLISDQIEDSMGGLMPIFTAFAAIVYALLLYLLTKMIVDRNAPAISMLKILGYRSREAGSIYSAATAIVVIASLILSMPLENLVMRLIYEGFMKYINGWLPYYMAPWIRVFVPAIGIGCWVLIYLLESRRIRRISLATALKKME